MRKYLPEWLSDLIKQYGVHHISVMKKALELSFRENRPIVVKRSLEDLTLEELEFWKRVVEECAREGKYIPVKKFAEALKS